LLAKALQLIESAGDQSTPDLIHLTHVVLTCQWDIPAVVQLLDKYLAQDLPAEEEAWARWHRADWMAVLGTPAGDLAWCRKAVAGQRELAEFVAKRMSRIHLPWVWHDSTMFGAWSWLGLREEWLASVEPVIANAVAVPENRSDRYELLNTTVSVYDVLGMPERAEALLDEMRRVLAEDPEWHERQWAEDRLHKQNVGRPLRAGDTEGMRTAAREYERWISSQDPPMVPSPLGDIAFLFLEGKDYANAIHYCEVAAAAGNSLGYTHVWYAAAVVGQSGDLDRAAELLQEARRRMPAEQVRAAAIQRPEFADHLEDERLIAAMAP